MPQKKQTLGQLELEVLKIVWDKKGCSVSEAAEILSRQNGYARTTILTVMQRLHKKDFLIRKKEDGIFHYYPTEKKTTVLGKMAHQFVENIFEGSSSNMVQHLIDGNIQPEELARIRTIIDDALSSERKDNGIGS